MVAIVEHDQLRQRAPHLFDPEEIAGSSRFMA
jgi:hypothetical protein